jgi:hypothetical protein
MTSPGLFLLKEDGSLLGMRESRYDSEALLQELLARYPDLLAGDQIDPTAPRRWLLITRELGVPDEIDAANRWSLDHLFVDQEGIPTLVEVKRSTDTRIRRDVVGQMLDYAANAILHWPIETIRSAFEERCQRDGKDPARELNALLGSDTGADAFWTTVRTNLQAGRIRMLFVSDSIPAELRRVVEFLNRQMETAEVLAVEVRQYVGEDLKTLVPRVFGQSAQAEQQKRVGSARRAEKWDEASFFARLAESGKNECVGVARALFDWAKSQMEVDYGHGLKYASFVPFYEGRNGWFGPFVVYSNERGGHLEIRLSGTGMSLPPFDSPERKLELIQRLNTIPGMAVEEDVARFPTIELSALVPPEKLRRFISIMDWMVGLVKAAETAPEPRTASMAKMGTTK